MCKQKRARPKNSPKNDLTKIDTQLVEIKDQMKTLTENITTSNALIETVKLELNEVKKTKPQNFTASLGAVKMCKKIDTLPPVRSLSNLGVRIRGVPENTTGTPDEQFQADIKAVEKILVFLKIDDKKLSKIQRIGRNDPDRTTPRTLIVIMENMLSKELLFISRELSTSDTKLEYDCLRKRRFLIEDKQKDQKISESLT